MRNTMRDICVYIWFMLRRFPVAATRLLLFARKGTRAQCTGQSLPVPAPMEAQSFSGSPLVRGLRRGVTLQQALEAPGLRLLPVLERKVGSSPDGSLAWFSRDDLPGMGWTVDSNGGALVPSRASTLPEDAFSLPLYVLGQTEDSRWHFAVDVSSASFDVLTCLPRLSDLRGHIPRLSPSDLAIAGQAVALTQWHASHQFCHQCGGPTQSAEGGARRQCTANEQHRLYPRTDPVVIMLVESPDGSSALLGRPLNYRMGNMLTCLSGFVDQGESVEEAVAREVHEEAGLKLTKVEILGTQPWPIGRAGSCELMLGCIAKAASSDIDVDHSEMETVLWVPKEEVRVALDKGADGSLVQNPSPSKDDAPFWLPPRFAIAHHLLKIWASQDGPWFNDETAARKASL